MTDTALTVKQVAEQLSVRQHAILALIRSGSLIAVDVSLKPDSGRPRWRIMESDLTTWIDGRIHQPAAPRRRRRKKPNNIPQIF